MGETTGIEWTRGADGRAGATWNPVRAMDPATGKIGWHCEHVTEACRFCYAEALNLFRGTGLPFKPDMLKSGRISIFLDQDMLTRPMRWRRARKIFVCSMTDLFAWFITRDMRDQMFAVMALCPWHTFIILTKRWREMQADMSDPETPVRIRAQMRRLAPGQFLPADEDPDPLLAWPLPNVWAGASIHDQPSAEEVVPFVLDTPAFVRFLSIEPLLGPVNLRRLLIGNDIVLDALTGQHSAPGSEDAYGLPLPSPRPRLDQVIDGGESGPKARPTPPVLFRSLRDQCAGTGTAYFHKQNGEWIEAEVVPGGDLGGEMRAGLVQLIRPDGSEHDGHVRKGDVFMRRVGKKAAGRLLDGREHNGSPT